MTRLQQLFRECGQSPWLDNLKRSYLTSGELAEMRDRGIRGLTSNPTIFQKAIQGSSDYDAQFSELAADVHPVLHDYWEMVLADIHGACDVLDPVYAESDGLDGYASVEVAPNLALDEAGTVEAARELHSRLDRRNLMVKIPATDAGVGAIRQMISQGRNINVTLVFSLDRYADVMEAYISGLEAYASDPGADLSRVASVGSFFVSRVDTDVDRLLEAIGTDEALALRGKAAVAQAKLAYKLFSETFRGPRWDKLAARGARVQRPLWASTGTKNKAYSDVLYVDELIGPDTVNTLTEATIEAFEDHGQVRRTVDTDLDGAERVWAQLAAVGVDLDDVSARLEREGVDAFTKSFDELIDALQTKVDELRA